MIVYLLNKRTKYISAHLLSMIYTAKSLLSVCNIQLDEIMHHRAAVFESTYLKLANFKNVSEIGNPLLPLD